MKDQDILITVRDFFYTDLIKNDIKEFAKIKELFDEATIRALKMLLDKQLNEV